MIFAECFICLENFFADPSWAFYKSSKAFSGVNPQHLMMMILDVISGIKSQFPTKI